MLTRDPGRDAEGVLRGGGCVQIAVGTAVVLFFYPVTCNGSLQAMQQVSSLPCKICEETTKFLPNYLWSGAMRDLEGDPYSRPWFALYQSDRGLLAQRIAQRAATSTDGEAAEQELPLPFELWLLIGSHFGEHFSSLCRLSAVCRALWPLGRYPNLWEEHCRRAYCLRGQLPCDTLLREYGWSWQRMFARRPRLRFDGIYVHAHTKLLRGTQEGRGMKETDIDFYAACGKWRTYYRLFRFFPDGSMFAFITSVPPLEVCSHRPGCGVTGATPTCSNSCVLWPQSERGGPG